MPTVLLKNKPNGNRPVFSGYSRKAQALYAATGGTKNIGTYYANLTNNLVAAEDTTFTTASSDSHANFQKAGGLSWNWGNPFSLKTTDTQYNRDLEAQHLNELKVLTVKAKNGVSVYSGSDNNNQIIKFLPYNTKIDIISRNKESTWIKLRLSDGSEGWIPYSSDYITLSNDISEVSEEYNLQEIKTSSFVRTIEFGLLHPLISKNVGRSSHGSLNFSTISARFAEGTQLPKGDNSGSHINAFRHTMWQALLTQNFSAEMAEKIGNAHEENPNIDLAKRTFYTLEAADQTADLLNNILGRRIGVKNNHTSNRDLSLIILKEFKNNGLWVVDKNDNFYVIKKIKISDTQYVKALENLSIADENGYTPIQWEQRQQELSNK